MRDDLLDAKASVDWAISNFPSIPHVAINESGIVERKPIIASLGYFARYVTFVIKLFDTPRRCTTHVTHSPAIVAIARHNP